MIDPPQYLHGTAGLKRCTERILAQRSTRRLSRWGKANFNVQPRPGALRNRILPFSFSTRLGILVMPMPRLLLPTSKPIPSSSTLIYRILFQLQMVTETFCACACLRILVKCSCKMRYMACNSSTDFYSNSSRFLIALKQSSVYNFTVVST